MRDDESKFVTEIDIAAWCFENEAAMFIACKFILHAVHIQ